MKNKESDNKIDVEVFKKKLIGDRKRLKESEKENTTPLRIVCINGVRLIKKYQGMKGEIEKQIDYYAKEFNKKPFKEKEKKVWLDSIKEYLIFLNQDWKEPVIKKEREKIVGAEIFSRRGQIETFWEQQPFYYDESKIFWIWDLENKKWKVTDEITFLNSIQEKLGVETIDGKTKSELISGFQQVGRKHKPKDMKKSWVQFKNKIYDQPFSIKSHTFIWCCW